MNTREIGAEYRISRWTQIVSERKSSGLSVKAYCESAGIRENTYYYWLRKLREAACEGLSAMQSDEQSPRRASPMFAEIKLPELAAQSTAVAGRQSQVCVQVGKVRLTAGSEYPIEKLSELLSVVVRSCC